MKINNVRKLYIIFEVLIFSILITGCRIAYLGPKYMMEVYFEESYNQNEDITLTVTMGLSSDTSYKHGEYIIAYSTTDEVSEEATKILYRITDLSKQEYYYTPSVYKPGKKIKYNFTQKFTLANELFSESSGEFYILMYEALEEYVSGSRLIFPCSYKIKDGILIIELK